MGSVLTWGLGLIGWGGALALAVAIVFLGMTFTKKVLIIAFSVIALAIGAWGAAGHVEASLEAKAKVKVEQERDELKGEIVVLNAKITELTAQRNEARELLETCSAGVESLATTANLRKEEARVANENARKARAAKDKLAREFENLNPSTPGDDYKSARDIADEWLRRKHKEGK